MAKETIYSAELRQDQWELICMALDHVRGLINGGEGTYSVDKLGRKFLLRCVNETVSDIGAQVPHD